MVDPRLAKMNELERRLFLGEEAIKLGFGGIVAVSKKYHVARGTVTRGVKEVKSGIKYDGKKIRKPGGGAKTVEEKHPELPELICSYAEKELAGETGVLGERTISRLLLEEHGIKISQNSVGRVLNNCGYYRGRDRVLRKAK